MTMVIEPVKTETAGELTLGATGKTMDILDIKLNFDIDKIVE